MGRAIGRLTGRGTRRIGVALATGAVLASAGVFGVNASASEQGARPVAGSGASAGGHAAGQTAAPAAEATPAAAARPAAPAVRTGPAMLLDTISPSAGTTVGVAMPVSVTFTDPVAASARASVERHLDVTTSVPVTGAWHWFGDKRVDWRPQTYWPSGTEVSVDADLTGVADGHGRHGIHDYHHTFAVGSDTEVAISASGHTMRVTRDGAVVRTMPIDAGSASWPSWDGTMAVMGKAKEVRMTSCSVHITCDKKDPDFYDTKLPWDVQLTSSGTYIHFTPGDPEPGHSDGSHGCVHLSLANAKWFYDYVKQGDPVTITGSPRGNTAADNGYAAFSLSWSQWLAGSTTGAETTAVPV